MEMLKSLAYMKIDISENVINNISLNDLDFVMNYILYRYIQEFHCVVRLGHIFFY